MFTDEIHQHIHHCRIAQGAGFDGVNGGIVSKAPELLANQLGGDRLGAINVARILNREAGQNGQGVAAQRGDCLNVGLDAGAAGGVEAGKNQNLGSGIAFNDSAPQNGLTTARMTTARRIRTGNSLNQR